MVVVGTWCSEGRGAALREKDRGKVVGLHNGGPVSFLSFSQTHNTIRIHGRKNCANKLQLRSISQYLLYTLTQPVRGHHKDFIHTTLVRRIAVSLLSTVC